MTHRRSTPLPASSTRSTARLRLRRLQRHPDARRVCQLSDQRQRHALGQGAKIKDKDGGVNEYTRERHRQQRRADRDLHQQRPGQRGLQPRAHACSDRRPTSPRWTRRAKFTFAFDCGTAPGFGAYSVTPTLRAQLSDQRQRQRSVEGKIKDDDGGVNEYTRERHRQQRRAPRRRDQRRRERGRGLALQPDPGAVTDPGTDTVTSYVVHWGDGSPDTYAANGVKTHTYADGPDDPRDHGRPRRRGRHLPRPRERALGHRQQRRADDRDQRRRERRRGLALQPDAGRGHRPGHRHGHELRRPLGRRLPDTYAANGVKTHTYADGPNDHAITVDLVDEDGTFLDRANALSVTVNNVAPTIAISGAASVNEGSLYSLTLGAVTDPGTDTVIELRRALGRRLHRHLRHERRRRRTPTPTGPTTTRSRSILTDEDGTFLDRANPLSVHVNNVAPPRSCSPRATPVHAGPSRTSAEAHVRLLAPAIQAAMFSLRLLRLRHGTALRRRLTHCDLGSSAKLPNGGAAPLDQRHDQGRRRRIRLRQSRGDSVTNVPPTITSVTEQTRVTGPLRVRADARSRRSSPTPEPTPALATSPGATVRR